jgi:methylated-DNA-[protein]-cysteine S-methyltransferase
MEMYYTEIDSPVGVLLLAGTADKLRRVEFSRRPAALGQRDGWQRAAAPFGDAIRQLRAYFAGDLTRFDLPLDPQGTEFQCRAWMALREIPYGETRTYAEQARRIGKPAAVRAVGAANSRNPLAIVVPCHRVIGSDGSLTGFGGGLDVKRQLLEHERSRRA